MSIRDEIRVEVAEALGVASDTVDDNANLIELGLDSIRMMQIAGGWRKRGYRVGFGRLAAEPTIARWTEILTGMAPPLQEGYSSEQPPGAANCPSRVSEMGPIDSGDDSFELAPMQHAYWIGRTNAAALGGVAAHLYVEFDSDSAGLEEPGNLRSAVRALMELHPQLRAEFLPQGTQRIRDSAPDVVVVNDLRDLADDEVQSRLEAIRDTKSHQMLPIENGQVLDVTLSLLPRGRHRLHIDVDMLAADAISYRMLLADLAEILDGGHPMSTEFTYRDYLRHRADHPDPSRIGDRSWWLERLGDLPGGPQLPTAREPVDGASAAARVVRHHHWIDADGKQALLAAAHEHGVTPAMTVAAVFAATIGAWSSTDRFLLNVPLFQREPVHPDVDRISGDFSSSILLDVDLSVGGSILDLVHALQTTMHTNGSHAGYGALEVLRDLGRYRGEQVLAPVVFTSALGLGELFSDVVLDRLGEPVWIVSQGPQVLLDAQVTELRGGLLLNWDVRESAFPEGVIQSMFETFVAGVDALTDGEKGWSAPADRPLPLSQRMVRDKVNDTEGPSTGRSLHQEFFAIAADDPDRTALLWRDGAMTYGELAEQALALAGALAHMGVRAGDAVGVQLPKGPEQVIATLGVFASGAVWVPIGYSQPEARRARILETGGIGVVVGTPGARGGLPDGVSMLDFESARSWESPAAQAFLPDPEQVAYILFTSGSTGTPKGVEVPHRAAMNTIDAVNDRFGVGADDRSLTVAALEFDISVYDIFGLYSAGGAVIAVGTEDATDPGAWLDLLRVNKGSVLTCVPSALDMLLTVAETDSDGLGDSLRVALLGGDWVGVDLPRRLHALSPGARFAGLGGATEIAIHGTVCETVDPPEDWRSVPFGTPLRNVVCRVTDSRGNDRPDWATGELWVAGAGVATGYRGDPQRTSERFVEYGGRRWYRTGDLARYWPDGTIEFLGRADHQVKIRGFRVELGEVESALRGMPGVAQAIAAPHRSAGGATVLAAAVTGADDLDPEVILAALRDVLPTYMIPSRVLVIDSMPLTPNGKIDRNAIGARLGQFTDTERMVAAPNTDLERAVRSIVAEVLAVSASGIGVTDDFFSIGGDSVLATTVIGRIREWLHAPHVGVVDIFAGRTVRGLAERIDAGDPVPGRMAQVAALYLEVVEMDDNALSEAASGIVPSGRAAESTVTKDVPADGTEPLIEAR